MNGSADSEFWIDVGGTFTDCIAVSTKGEIKSCKVLSSGVYQSQIEEGSTVDQVVDNNLSHYPEKFFLDYNCIIYDAEGKEISSAKVSRFTPSEGKLGLESPLAIQPKIGLTYELTGNEEAPLFAMRSILGVPLDTKIDASAIKLGTTRGTNALLERKGEKFAFVTTKGFGDLLEIGTGARPKLFALEIQKPSTLYSEVKEIDERINSSGRVLTPISPDTCRAILKDLRSKKIDSLAICFINSYRNPVHEKIFAAIAKEEGFSHVSISTSLTATIKALDRGQTASVDAYLCPILKDYLTDIQLRVPSSNLKIMTSAGGLTQAEKFVGKDSILSGPAGGVVGFTQAAKAAGCLKAIGFDMGGTSTDVSRFDGGYEYEYSSEKGGVRIVSPMLAIETVAAGGGSICRFDGQKFVVGPQSAGAIPGPACYGKGGPLTVTDLNVFSGIVRNPFFPFPLQTKAVEKRLLEIQLELQKTLGKEMDLASIVSGFREVANLKMANAIKTVSSAKGINPSEYTLVSFGGAGAQHACAIAELLEMDKILLHPYGGILSAFGVGQADIKKFAEKTVLVSLSEKEISNLERDFLDLEKQLIQEVLDERVQKEDIEIPIRIFDLRFKGEEAVIPVEGKQYHDLSASFKKLHRQFYGHDIKGREIEIAAIRVRVIGTTKKHHFPKKRGRQRFPKPDAEYECLFKGRFYDTSFFHRENLLPGDVIQGPAVVIDKYATVALEPDWRGEISSLGDLILEKGKVKLSKEKTVEKNPIQLELYSNYFSHIAKEMGVSLQKSSLSTNIKERLDFSCAILDQEGDLVVNAPHIPVHLGAMGDCVKSLLRQKEKIQPGDVYLSNDPNLGGSHLPDLTVMTPVFIDNSLRFFTASRAHHAEIGGVYPGSFYPFAKNLAEEGVVFQNLLISRNEELLEDVLMEVLTKAPFPSRLPLVNIADIRAQIAANHTGVREILKMIDKEGWEIVGKYMEYLTQIAEEKTRVSIQLFPDGVYFFEDSLDDGTPIVIQIKIAGEEMHIDFSGSGPVHLHSLNANPSIVKSALIYCLRTIIKEDLPLNAGILRPLSINIPEGLLNPPLQDDPSLCVSVAGGNVEVSQRIVDVFFGALKIVAASQGTMNNFVFGNDQYSYYETICGGTGAGASFNGADAVQSNMTNTRITDVEVLENELPILVHQFSIRKDSGGSGLHKGGNGVVRELEFLEKLDVSLLTQRRTKGPFGLEGGEAGLRGKNLLIKNGQEEELPSLTQLQVEKGDRIKIETPGGGGYGA